MEHYAGIDVSSVCVVDTQGKIVKEAKVASDAEDLIAFFASLGFAVTRRVRLIDVELSIRGILRGFGLKIGVVTRKGFEPRVREVVTGQATIGTHH